MAIQLMRFVLFLIRCLLTFCVAMQTATIEESVDYLRCDVTKQIVQTETEFQGLNYQGVLLLVRHCPCIAPKFADYLNEVESKQISTLNVTNLLCQQGNVSKMTFHKLESLHTLAITDSHITTVEEKSFEGMFRVEVIDLRRNHIAVLSHMLFNGCRRLKQLYLGSNRIKELPNSIFTFTEDLVELDLSYNYLEVITSTELFKKTNQIKQLHLQGNRLTQIHGNTFTKLNSLVFLNLSHNHMSFMYSPTCNGRMKIQENHFWFVDMALMSNGSLIDFRHNQITGLRFEGIRKSCIHGRCKTLTLLLDDNPLSCGCDGHDLIKYRRRQLPENVMNSIYIDKEARLTCTSPHSNQTLLLSYVNTDTIYCDLDACPNCPPGCSCKLHRNSRMVIIKCEGLRMKALPSDLPITKECRSELWLSHNELTTFDNITYPYMVNVLSLAYNQISKLPQNFPKFLNLKVLELDNNQLEIITAEEMRQIKTLRLARLTLGNNRWNCSDCRILLLVRFLRNSTNVINDRTNIICWNSHRLVESIDMDMCKKPSPYILILLFAIISLTTIIIVFYFWRKISSRTYELNLPTAKLDVDADDLSEKIYDAFVSYSHEDENYVVALVKELENPEDPLKLCLHSRDWTPGEFIVKQMAQSVSRSRTSIIILSSAYFKSKWCYSEFRIALTQMLVRRNHKVIAIWLSEEAPDKGKLDPDFRLYFSTCTYLRHDDKKFMDKLRTALARCNS